MDKLNAGIHTPGYLNAARGSVYSGHVETECSKPPADVTVSATQIADRSDAFELLHELDKHAGQLLAGLTVARGGGLPFKLCVRLHSLLAITERVVESD